MYGYDSSYVSGLGKIITQPGTIIHLGQDTLSFSARGDSTVILLTSDNDAFEKETVDIRAFIKYTLLKHTGWNESPVFFMDKLLQAATNSSAMAESMFVGLFFDTGTALLEDHLFSHGGVQNNPSGEIMWRRVCSPMIEMFSTGYVIKNLSTLFSSFKVKNVNVSTSALNKRRKIVADALSILIAVAVQIMYVTNGELTYIPDGHCVNIAMSSYQSDNVNLVINDPSGSGWKMLSPPENKVVEAPTTRLLDLVEFCSKCVVDAVSKNGLNNASMKKIVDSANIYPDPPRRGGGGRIGCGAGYPRVVVLTSGNSTTEGNGALCRIAEGGGHNMYRLSEYRVDVQSIAEVITVNIEPREIGKYEYTSPSILQWFDILLMPSLYDESTNVSLPLPNNTNILWKSVPVTAVHSPRQWRACEVSDKIDDPDEYPWRNRLIRAHKFEWACSAGKRVDNRTLMENISVAVSIVSHNTFNEDSKTVRTHRNCATDNIIDTKPSSCHHIYHVMC
uniref:Envelope and capsid protein n=1 Tax=Chionoecetes opilio bacilliform virus TaxID=1825681 RepID=A0A1Q3DL62_9VIRU|nr:envelope and capsid protein [Chionoecetes opilio bacilliform virus]